MLRFQRWLTYKDAHYDHANHNGTKNRVNNKRKKGKNNVTEKFKLIYIRPCLRRGTDRKRWQVPW